MKWFIGFSVLLVTLVMISGCTQPAQTAAPATTIPTPVPTTEQVIVATPVPTMIETTVATTVPTTVVTTSVPTTQPTVAAVTVNMTTIPTVTAASMVTTIHFTSAGFNPQRDVILPGTGITWVNDDTVDHAVKSTGKNDGLFTSTPISPNAAFSYTFANEGTVEYALVDLPKINGTIVVKISSSSQY
jgi:plastocyanin